MESVFLSVQEHEITSLLGKNNRQMRKVQD